MQDVFGKLFKKTKKEKKPNAKRTLNELYERLKRMPENDPGRKALTDEIKTFEEIVENRKKTKITIAQVAGTLGISATAMYLGHKIEKSEDIVQNKMSFEWFKKIFKG